jgi:wobble nucleotide-excising tRNase
MSVSKKQVNELENAVVVLEERIEKMEEEHKLLKQMLSMQSTLIDNLQMMMKMMSTSVPSTQQYKVFQLGGDETMMENEGDTQNNDSDKQTKLTSPSINKMKFRMSRVL